MRSTLKSGTSTRTDVFAWLAFVLLLACALGWGLDPQFGWDVDNTAPGSVLRAIAQHFGPRWSSSYGPVPYVVMALPMLPLLLFFRLTHELGHPAGTYPWGFAHPAFSINALTLGARLMTLACAALIAAMALRAARADGARARWPVLVLLAGSATFAYYAGTSNVDLHYLLWLWAGFHLAEGARGRRGLAAAAACASLAVCAKEQAAPLALVIVLLAMVRGARGVGERRGGLLDALVAPLAAAAAFALAWRLPFGLPGLREHLRFVFEDARYERTFPATLAGFGQLAARGVAELPVALGWAVLAGVALALALRVSWRGLEARALACALYLVLFLGGIGYVYPRFLLPLLLLALPLAARGLDALAGDARRVALGAVAVLALLGAPALTWTQWHDSRLAMERWLAPRLAAGASVELAGNPHFQARLPAGRCVAVKADELRHAPRAPRADLVLVSAQDEAYFERDPAVRAAWYAPLHAGREYRAAFTAARPWTARFAADLPVSPVVTAYERIAAGR